MIFTSGTSGDPKAVRFAHAMAVMCGTSLVDRFELTSDDVCYLSMPLFHSNGVAAGWAVAIACGATMVAREVLAVAVPVGHPPVSPQVHELRW
jgi:fatty-acyl-CoA synthase